MKALILLITAMSLSSSATEYAELPFEPAYASEQPKITFDSLGGEIGQFQQMSNWHSMLGNIRAKKLELENLKKAYERGRVLLGNGTITRDEFERREFTYKMSEGNINEMENRAQMLRVSVETTKLGIIMQGSDQETDLRRDIAQKMKESLEFQLKALNFARDNSVRNEAFQKKRAEDAKDLFNKKVISQIELDRRVQEYEEARIQLDVLAHQTDVIGKAVGGLDRSLEKLFGQP